SAQSSCSLADRPSTHLQTYSEAPSAAASRARRFRARSISGVCAFDSRASPYRFSYLAAASNFCLAFGFVMPSGFFLSPGGSASVFGFDFVPPSCGLSSDRSLVFDEQPTSSATATNGSQQRAGDI